MERLKQLILAYLPLSADAILLLLGLLCYLATCLAFRRPLTWAWALLAGTAAGPGDRAGGDLELRMGRRD